MVVLERAFKQLLVVLVFVSVSVVVEDVCVLMIHTYGISCDFEFSEKCNRY